MKKIIFPIAAAMLISVGTSIQGMDKNVIIKQQLLKKQIEEVKAKSLAYFKLFKINPKMINLSILEKVGTSIVRKKSKLGKIIGKKNAAIVFGMYNVLVQIHNSVIRSISPFYKIIPFWLKAEIDKKYAYAIKYIKELQKLHIDLNPKKNKYLFKLQSINFGKTRKKK